MIQRKYIIKKTWENPIQSRQELIVCALGSFSIHRRIRAAIHMLKRFPRTNYTLPEGREQKKGEKGTNTLKLFHSFQPQATAHLQRQLQGGSRAGWAGSAGQAVFEAQTEEWLAGLRGSGCRLESGSLAGARQPEHAAPH